MAIPKIFKLWAQSSLILFFGLYAINGAFHIEKLWLIDGANLLFHEAGHMIFGLLGQTIGIWGGTLLQLLFPLGIGVAFLRQKKLYSASFMLLWLGENAFGISNYIKDARTQSLPLVGGEIHDWGYLLGKYGLLEYDQVIGDTVWVCGFMTVLAAMVCGLIFAGDKYRATR